MKIKSGIVSRILSQGVSVHDEGLTVNFPRKNACVKYMQMHFALQNIHIPI